MFTFTGSGGDEDITCGYRFHARQLMHSHRLRTLEETGLLSSRPASPLSYYRRILWAPHFRSHCARAHAHATKPQPKQQQTRRETGTAVHPSQHHRLSSNLVVHTNGKSYNWSKGVIIWRITLRIWLVPIQSASNFHENLLVTPARRDQRAR